VTEHDIDPRELGIPRAKISDLLGKDAGYNAGVVRAVLAGDDGPVRDIVLLNAAAGLVAFELASDPSRVQESILDRFRSQMAVAAQAIDSGAAAAKLDEWVAATH
ncbi:MAG TPA: anthranilate phosphoribosyltransferase, partial [Leifsonia sp.]